MPRIAFKHDIAFDVPLLQHLNGAARIADHQPYNDVRIGFIRTVIARAAIALEQQDHFPSRSNHATVDFVLHATFRSVRLRYYPLTLAAAHYHAVSRRLN